MPAVLFICTANQFRSPIAAACFQRELTARGLRQTWRVLSAGTWTTTGRPPLPVAVEAARQLQLDISEHRSRVVTPALMSEADLVLVMEHGQREALASEFPGCADKIHLLSQAAAHVSYDIPDPISSPSPDEIHIEIDGLIHRNFENILALATPKDGENGGPNKDR